jgi:hypothetical protein
MNTVIMKNSPCPLCGQPLVQESDQSDFDGDYFCQTRAQVAGHSLLNHYRYSLNNENVTMIIPPYRILTDWKGESRIGIRARYKTGQQKYYFKTILTVPTIHPDTEEKLRNRIKTLLLFS